MNRRCPKQHRFISSGLAGVLSSLQTQRKQSSSWWIADNQKKNYVTETYWRRCQDTILPEHKAESQLFRICYVIICECVGCIFKIVLHYIFLQSSWIVSAVDSFCACLDSQSNPFPHWTVRNKKIVSTSDWDDPSELPAYYTWSDRKSSFTCTLRVWLQDDRESNLNHL